MIMPAVGALGFGSMLKLAGVSAGIQGGLGLIGQNMRGRAQRDLSEYQNRAAQDQFVANLGANFLQGDYDYSQELAAEQARLGLATSDLYRDKEDYKFGQKAALAGFGPAQINEFSQIFG